MIAGVHRLPLLEEHPIPLQVLLAGVVPLAFGLLTGYLLGVSEGAYTVLSLLAIIGGIGAGFDHLGATAGAKRGVLGGSLFSVGILIAHEIHGAEAKADIPHPAILIVPIFVILGALFGALGGWLRDRGNDRPSPAGHD
jgi:hypothetical protein